MSLFVLTMIYGSFGILALFSAGYYAVVEKQVIPFMVFSVMGLLLLIMGYKTNPYKEED